MAGLIVTIVAVTLSTAAKGSQMSERLARLEEQVAELQRRQGGP
jgi:hypothetical protein